VDRLVQYGCVAGARLNANKNDALWKEQRPRQLFPPANQDWLEKADDISAGPDHRAHDYDKKNNKVSSFRID